MKVNVVTNSQVANPEFKAKGVNQEVARNQLKVLLTQDIWAPSLKVKRPETELEKEVLLEILNYRAKLDRYVRLTNEKLHINGLLSVLSKLIDTNPSSPEIPALRAEIDKKGNVFTYLSTLNKNIELERNKRKPAIAYFDEIQKLGDEYEDKKLVKNSMLSKFWDKINKNNINPDGKLSTKELIELVSESPKVEVVEPLKATAKPLSKKQLISAIQSEYEQMLREGVDVYMGQGMHNMVASNARKALAAKYESALNKFPEVRKQLVRLYEAVEKKYTFKVDRLEGIDIHPLDRIWKDMIADEKAIKLLASEITKLRAESENNPEVKQQIEAKVKELQELKSNWLARLNCSIKFENENRGFMAEANRLSDYEYLTSENPTINRHKRLYEMSQNKDENLWEEVLK